ncbi:unnamed protein product, partial [Rotaria sordida]
MESNGE